MTNTFLPADHPRADSGKFVHTVHGPPSIRLAAAGAGLTETARHVFPNAEGIGITAARVGPEGPVIEVDMDGAVYDVVYTAGTLDVLDEDGESINPHGVLSALTGGDDDPEAAVLDACQEFSELASANVAPMTGIAEIAADATAVGHRAVQDAETGTVTISTMTRKYTAAVSVDVDGGTIRTINGHTVPYFGRTFGDALNLERWTEQHSGQIAGALGSFGGQQPHTYRI